MSTHCKSLYLLVITFFVASIESKVLAEIRYDKYGQSNEVDFPDKVKNDDELKKTLIKTINSMLHLSTRP